MIAFLTLGLVGEAPTACGQISDNQKLELFEAQVQRARVRGDQREEVSALKGLMQAALSARDFRRGIQAGEAQLPLLRQMNLPKEEMEVLQSVSMFYKELREYPQEVATAERMLEVAKKIGDNRQAISALEQIGVAQRNQGNYPQSLEALEAALALAKGDRQEESSVRSFLSLTYEISGDYARAVEQAEQAVELRKQRDQAVGMGAADALQQLGRVYFLAGKQSQAVWALKQSLAALQQGFGSKLPQANRLEDLGFILFRGGDVEEAEQTLRAAVAAFDAARDELIGALPKELQDDGMIQFAYELNIDSARLLQQVLVARARPAEALEFAERGRASELAAQLRERSGAQPSSPTIDAIKRIAKEQQSTIVEYSVINDALWHHPVRSGMNMDPPPTGLLVWVIGPNGEMGFRSVDLEPLAKTRKISLSELVRNARESIGAVGRDAHAQGAPTTATLRQLHAVLIEPIADLLPNDPQAHVTFIPQDALFLVPFAALQDGSGTYLIESHTISTAPSIETLDLTHRMHERGKAGTGSLVVGNPTMPLYAEELGGVPQPLPPLERAEVEARAVAAALDTQPLIGAQATRAAVVRQLPNVRTVHLATHGILDDQSGLRSAVALAPSDGDNGFLTAEEILRLRLSADLAVLSACDTGRGRITGDGVVGLSRSFMSAGVPSVVVSLWSIQDAPASSLMTNFHQALKQNPDKAQALRQAMLSSKTENPSPLDWAGFVLIGETR